MTETRRKPFNFDWHVVLLPILYPLFLFTRNYWMVPASEFMKASGLSVVFFLSIYLVLRQFIKHVETAAVTTSFTTIFFYSFGHLYGPLQTKFISTETTVSFPLIGQIPVQSFSIGVGLMFVLVATGVFGWRLLIRDPKRASRVSGILTVFSVSMLAIQFALLVPRIVLNRLSEQQLEADANTVFPPFERRETDIPTTFSDRPDIYYILPDGYARNDVLKNYYGYDNSPFCDALIKQGFQIAQKSRSPYYWTLTGMGGILNMGYFLPHPRLSGPYQRGGPLSHYVLRYNRAARFLKSIGYEYVQTSSSWNGMLTNPYADRLLHGSESPFQIDYYRALVEATLLRSFLARENSDLAASHLKTFENIKKIASEKDGPPKFVFVHLIPPHPPYLFDQDGRILRHTTVADQFNAQTGLWKKKEAYVQQLLFVNKKLLDVIHAIKANPARQAVIIIGSDHGAHIARNTPGVRYVNERFKNFVAVYSTNPRFTLPVDINSVNLLRLVFNAHVGTSFDVLPAKNYYSPFEDPYMFIEIND